MFAMKSNITSAIGNLNRIARTMDEHIATAFDPKLYTQACREGTRAILMQSDNLTDQEKETQVPILVDTITVESGPRHSLLFQMGGMSIWTDERSGVNMILNPPSMDEVTKWIELGKQGDPDGKRLDSRDQFQEDDVEAGHLTGDWQETDVIARRVMAAMQRRPDLFFGTTEPDKKSLDPSGLPMFAGLTGVHPEDFERVLIEVLAAWKRWLTEQMPIVDDVVWRIRTALEAA